MLFRMTDGQVELPRSARRADIQGLRAVAVLGVIAFHLLGWPRGGYLGVMALAGVGVVLTTVYFAKVVRRIAQGTSFQAWKDAVLLRDATTHELVVWAPVVGLVVVLGLWPGFLLDASDPVVRRLLGGG